MKLDADTIARAIVTACRETGEDPISVVTDPMCRFAMTRTRYHGHKPEEIVGLRHHHARFFAYHALHRSFPTANKETLAKFVGAQKLGSFLVSVNNNKYAPWLTQDGIERVYQAIGAPQEASQYPVTACEFKVGDIIRHLSYGKGTIVGIGQWNARRRDYPLIIRFEQSDRTQTLYSRVVRSALRKDSTVIESAEKKSRFTFVTDQDLIDAPDELIEQLSSTAQKRAAGLSRCESCGRRCSYYSSKQCRSCYEDRTGHKRTAQPPAPTEIKNLPVVFTKKLTQEELDLLKPRLHAIVREGFSKLTMRRPVVENALDNTAELMGDPAPQRSALADAKPWQPYEARAEDKNHY
jgi:DNA-directed RNA polymerase subunit M/transcription elongation factor TFIIS